MLVDGVYGKKPALLSRSIGSQSQYARGIFADFDAASAFSLMALKLMPGGSMSPFCEQPIVTSTPHAVVAVFDRAERGDRVDQQQRRMARGVDLLRGCRRCG